MMRPNVSENHFILLRKSSPAAHMKMAAALSASKRSQRVSDEIKRIETKLQRSAAIQELLLAF